MGINVAESTQQSAVSTQPKKLAISKLAIGQKDQPRINTKHANHFIEFLIRVHSRNSRLVLLDLRSSAEICGDILLPAAERFPWDEMHNLLADCELPATPIESRVRTSPPSEFNQYAASPSSVSRDAAVIVLGAEQFCPCAAAPEHAAAFVFSKPSGIAKSRQSGASHARN
jgi:hypothetical protein